MDKKTAASRRTFIFAFFAVNFSFIIYYGYVYGNTGSIRSSQVYMTMTKKLSELSFIENASKTEPEDYSWKSVKVLCFVETHPGNLERQTKYIKMTWGPKCDITLYISDKFNKTFPTIAVTNYTGYRRLWAKTRSTIQLLYDEYIEKADWFLKADDDTYVIVDNLRRFLASKNTDTDLEYYGKFFIPFVKGGYNSGGAGYVFGRATLKRVVEIGFRDNSTECPPVEESKAEDVTIGRCMQYSGIRCSRNVLDKEGRELFHSFTPEREFVIPWWRIPFYSQFSIHKLGGDQCCPKNAISYHYVKGSAMMFLEYLFHNFTRH